MEIPTFYELRVQETLDPVRSDWFDGLEVTPLAGGGTLISGSQSDQAALHGLLIKVRDLNLTLISVRRIEPGAELTFTRRQGRASRSPGKRRSIRLARCG